MPFELTKSCSSGFLFYGQHHRGVPMSKTFHLLGPDGSTYQSTTPGELGGNSRLKIYGRLTCSTANAALSKGGTRCDGSFSPMKPKRFLQAIGPAVAVWEVSMPNGKWVALPVRQATSVYGSPSKINS
jgi:hypothetical protein